MARTPRTSASSPTIFDVAQRAGVSQMTVSRVINGRHNVSAETRQKVNDIIKALGYAPNPAARSLAGADRLRVGLLYSNPSAFFLSEFLVGGFSTASRDDVQLVIEQCEDEGKTDEKTLVQRLLAKEVDGAILPPPLCESPVVLAAFAEAGVPLVTIASGHPAPGVMSVGIDDQAAARAMTRHLIALGHRRIGFVKGSPRLLASAERLAGYRDALAEAGIEPDPALIVEGEFTYRSGLDAAEELLALDERPSAIFASNDDMAAAVIAVAHGDRLDVPGDLSVVGFDDTGFATSIWPELTTIRQPIGEMAHSALAMLTRQLRNGKRKHEPEQRLLDFTLIRRQSDAPPRRRSRRR
ncbi:LacI family DNA-binding transcriptional regulator [Sphingomonas cannabina]|uniref:LacI family DNA-binding transcriptional regulator n=1 Tax=Sphingomonas cannabina TaxID=2899123 RepID=UPI001F2284D2|nr:LacI family DNA-binding transcriptional regulator [Sphingomonas cannabina]UIJ46390.1 LacI family DNA-binding transcriptional regulator [Sphingomonas cannabina]